MTTHVTPTPPVTPPAAAPAPSRWSQVKSLAGSAVSGAFSGTKNAGIAVGQFLYNRKTDIAVTTVGCVGVFLSAPYTTPLLASYVTKPAAIDAVLGCAGVLGTNLMYRGLGKTMNVASKWWNTPGYKDSEAAIIDHDSRALRLIQNKGSVKSLNYILLSGPLSEVGRSLSILEAVRLNQTEQLIGLLTTGKKEDNQHRFITMPARMEALRYGD